MVQYDDLVLKVGHIHVLFIWYFSHPCLFLSLKARCIHQINASFDFFMQNLEVWFLHERGSFSLWNTGKREKVTKSSKSNWRKKLSRSAKKKKRVENLQDRQFEHNPCEASAPGVPYFWFFFFVKLFFLLWNLQCGSSAEWNLRNYCQKGFFLERQCCGTPETQDKICTTQAVYGARWAVPPADIVTWFLCSGWSDTHKSIYFWKLWLIGECLNLLVFNFGL